MTEQGDADLGLGTSAQAVARRRRLSALRGFYPRRAHCHGFFVVKELAPAKRARTVGYTTAPVPLQAATSARPPESGGAPRSASSRSSIQGKCLARGSFFGRGTMRRGGAAAKARAAANTRSRKHARHSQPPPSRCRGTDETPLPPRSISSRGGGPRLSPRGSGPPPPSAQGARGPLPRSG